MCRQGDTTETKRVFNVFMKIQNEYMSGILKRLRWGRAIGVYFCSNRVSITDVGNTIKGLTILNQQSSEIADKESVQSLLNILQEYLKSRGGPQSQRLPWFEA